MSPDEQAELKEMSLQLLAQVSWIFSCTDFVFLAVPVREFFPSKFHDEWWTSIFYQFNINTFSREKIARNEWNDHQSENAFI